MVLDYDLLREMEYLQSKIIMPMQWKKVDSHIKARKYKDGLTPQGDKFSIRPNEVVDIWAGEVCEAVANKPLEVANPQIYFDKSRVMVQLEGDNRLIYGYIERQVEYEAAKGPIMTYLMEKNKHWTEKIFHMVDWPGMKMRLDKMEDTKVTNVLKLVHGWQNDE